MTKPVLTTEDRDAIRAMQHSAPYVRLMFQIQSAKPSLMLVDAASDNACAKRLHELRGWELCERALTTAADVRPLAATPDHDYSTPVPAGGEA